ncbi:MAG TPA: hypothetical protein VKM72_04240 [Thermoanaerobaculia bacterium]|nr:hypothetical protein [Thermoanaerobaculia bacterium]
MTRRTLLVPLFAAAFVLAPSELSGQVIPLSEVFLVSPRSYGSNLPGSYTTKIPTAAALADGSFVVSWGEDLEVIPPGEPSVPFFDLYARKIDATGTPGQLVRVDRGRLESVETERRPVFPELAADGQGGFVLAWGRFRFKGSDVLFQTVPPGELLHPGGRLLHKPKNDSWEGLPSVAANEAGDWVLAWNIGDETLGVSGGGVGVRAFQASGKPATAEIRITSPDPDVYLVRPRVAIQQDGSFMVIWGAFVSGGGMQTLQGRTFAANGKPLSKVFQIGQGMNAWEVVNGDPETGEFLVAWQKDTGYYGPRIHLRHYSARGRGFGLAELSYAGGLRQWRLTSNHLGDLAFLWVDASGGVLVRLLDSEGAPQEPPFVVTGVSDNPWIGDLTISDTGKIFAVWIGPLEVTTPGGATHLPLLGRLWEVQD